MRAAIFRNGDLVADEMPEPTPEAGQVLVKTLACGICGSDLHAFHHADKMVEPSLIPLRRCRRSPLCGVRCAPDHYHIR